MKENNIFDYSIFGSNEDENIREVYEREAFTNSLRMWIASYEGDYIGGSTRGGYVMEAISRPMTETDTELVYGIIYEGLTKDFRPAIQVQNLEVKPDWEKRRWVIELDYFVPELNFSSTIQESLKGRE